MKNPLFSDWTPIADSQYMRPQFSGEYELSVDGSMHYMRCYFDAAENTWRCAGDNRVWDFADAWRGCTVPFAGG